MGAVPEAAPGQEAERNRVVLVVEDETLVRLAIAAYLRDAGFTVIEAATAADARAVIQSRTEVDVVFADIHLPGDMDGLALADWIALQRAQLPVLITSGSYSLREPEKTAGRHFLPKPYIFFQVEKRLRALLATDDDDAR